MAKSLCSLLIWVYHVVVTIFKVANMPFNAIRENKILAKISELTVHVHLCKRTFRVNVIISLLYDQGYTCSWGHMLYVQNVCLLYIFPDQTSNSPDSSVVLWFCITYLL